MYALRRYLRHPTPAPPERRLNTGENADRVSLDRLYIIHVLTPLSVQRTGSNYAVSEMTLIMGVSHFVVRYLNHITTNLTVLCCSSSSDAWSIHRTDLIAILVRHVPRTCIRLGKRLVSYSDPVHGSITLTFADHTTATCDILVGADGLRSVVRGQMMRDVDAHASSVGVGPGMGPGAGAHASFASYVHPRWTGTIAYRALVPLASIRARNPAHPMLRGGVVVSGMTSPYISPPDLSVVSTLEKAEYVIGATRIYPLPTHFPCSYSILSATQSLRQPSTSPSTPPTSLTSTHPGHLPEHPSTVRPHTLLTIPILKHTSSRHSQHPPNLYAPSKLTPLLIHIPIPLICIPNIVYDTYIIFLSLAFRFSQMARASPVLLIDVDVEKGFCYTASGCSSTAFRGSTGAGSWSLS